jgi:hypothetical protein
MTFYPTHFDIHNSKATTTTNHPSKQTKPGLGLRLVVLSVSLGSKPSMASKNNKNQNPKQNKPVYLGKTNCSTHAAVTSHKRTMIPDVPQNWVHLPATLAPQKRPFPLGFVGIRS